MSVREFIISHLATLPIELRARVYIREPSPGVLGAVSVDGFDVVPVSSVVFDLDGWSGCEGLLIRTVATIDRALADGPWGSK